MARIYSNHMNTTGVAALAAMMTFRSTDRLGHVYVSSDNASTGTLADVGMYLAGSAHDGAVKDRDLFAAALAVDNGLARADVFTANSVLDDEDRWKQLWEILGYSVDPKVDFDLVLTCVTTALSGAATEVLVDVDYTSGD